MKIAKSILLIGIGAASVLAYQRYGDEVVESIEDMMDKKLQILSKMDEELEDMM